MKALLIKAWHDPVWSKVISWIIYTVLGAFALWAWSGFSRSLAVIQSSTLAIWTWLTSPTEIPVGVELLTLITFAALYWSLVIQRRRAIEGLAGRSALAIQNAVDEKSRETQQVTEQLRASELRRDRAEAELATHKNLLEAIHSPKLDTTALRVLKLLYSQYPRPVETNSIAGHLRIPNATAATACNDLKKEGMTRRVGHNYTTMQTGWVLTDDGRDACVKNKFDFSQI